MIIAGTASTATRERTVTVSPGALLGQGVPTLPTGSLCNASNGPIRTGGGDEGTRTPDPLLAKEVLSQLSYIPVADRCYPMRQRWWAFLDSNQRPLPYQGSALTS